MSYVPIIDFQVQILILTINKTANDKVAVHCKRLIA